MRSEEPWVPPIVVALLLGGALFWLSREADRLGTAGWWTFALLTAALLVLLGGPARTVLLWAGALALGGLLMLGWAILVPPPGAGPGARLDDLLLGRGMAAPTFLGAWLVVFATLLIVVVAVVRGTLGHPVVAVAAAAVAVVMTPLLGTAVAEPVHRVQAGFLVDHTTADHPPVTGSGTDGPTGPLRKRWTSQAEMLDAVVVGDTVITYAQGLVALDANTGTERWRYLLPDDGATYGDVAPNGAVVSPSTGIVVLPLGEAAVLLDIGSGEQVDILPLPALDPSFRKASWSPIASMNPYDSKGLETTGRLAMLGTDDAADGSGRLVAIDLEQRTVIPIEEHVASNCAYRVATEDVEKNQFLIRSECGPTEVTTFTDGRLRNRMTVPPGPEIDCAAEKCRLERVAVDHDKVTFVHAAGTNAELVSTQGFGVDWRQPYGAVPYLYPIPSSSSSLAHRLAVQQDPLFDPAPLHVIEAYAGTTVATPNVPLPDVATWDRWFAEADSTVTVIDTTTWRTVGTVDVGCSASLLRAGGRTVVAICDDGRLVGLSDE